MIRPEVRTVLALLYNKTNPRAYLIAVWPIKLNPQNKYRASIKYKAEGIKNLPGMTSRLFCIQHTLKNKFVGGTYYNGKVEENKWSEIVLEFQPPAEFDQTTVGFYLGRNATGKIW